MKFDKDNPKLTAYALGELDENERKLIEVEVAKSPELQQAVEEIRAMGESLADAFADQADDTLTDEQRSHIEKAADHAKPVVKKVPMTWRKWAVPLSVAASVAIVLGGISILLPGLSRARELSKRLVEQSATMRPQTVTTPATNPSSVNKRHGVARANRHARKARNISQRYVKMRGAYEPSAIESNQRGNGYVITQDIPAGYRQELDSLGYVGGTDSVHGVEDISATFNKLNAEGKVNVQQFISPSSGELSERSNSEAYATIVENSFLPVGQQPLSTFSIDVDTASYANVRRYLMQASQLPPPDAVRIEELINYFDYDYPQPTGDDPFSVNVEIADCPWAGQHRLVRVGLKGWEIAQEDRPQANLVFLVDVSGSMSAPNKLPLLKQSMEMLLEGLNGDDRVSIVVYAGASGLVLPPTYCDDHRTISAALNNLYAGGSTNGGAGIQLAYDLAEENFIIDGVNRVILATDGDFNVGVTNRGALTALIEEKAKTGVFLSVLGFGMGNLNDATLETLADKGNGNYAYIDTELEAQKVLVDQIGATLVTIAKDVKIQIEFNPAEVEAYRLIGYENRMLAAKDFNDDTKDAGEIGAGHTVTALYEIVPVGVALDGVDPLKYQTTPQPSEAADTGEMMTVKLRYKQPDGDTSQLIEQSIVDDGLTLEEASDDFAFAASVASFGMLLRGSPHSGDFTYDDIIALAESGLGEDVFGYRNEFLDMVKKAKQLPKR